MADVTELCQLFHYVAYDALELPSNAPAPIKTPAEVLVPVLKNDVAIEHAWTSDDKLVYGNDKGVNLVIGYDDQRTQLREMQLSISKLQTDMSLLKDASLGYRSIRSRFLDCFRRDRLGHGHLKLKTVTRWSMPHYILTESERAYPHSPLCTDCIRRKWPSLVSDIIF